MLCFTLPTLCEASHKNSKGSTSNSAGSNNITGADTGGNGGNINNGGSRNGSNNNKSNSNNSINDGDSSNTNSSDTGGIGSNEFLIEDIFVYPQEVTGSTVTTDQAAYTNWLYSLDDDTFNHIRMQGHSHVNMGVSPSGVDDKHRQQILDQLEKDMFYVFMVWNKSLSVHTLIYDMARNILYEDKDVMVKLLSDETMDAFLADAKEKVRKPKPGHKRNQCEETKSVYKRSQSGETKSQSGEAKSVVKKTTAGAKSGAGARLAKAGMNLAATGVNPASSVTNPKEVMVYPAEGGAGAKADSTAESQPRGQLEFEEYYAELAERYGGHYLDGVYDPYDLAGPAWRL